MPDGVQVYQRPQAGADPRLSIALGGLGEEAPAASQAPAGAAGVTALLSEPFLDPNLGGFYRAVPTNGGNTVSAQLTPVLGTLGSTAVQLWESADGLVPIAGTPLATLDATAPSAVKAVSSPFVVALQTAKHGSAGYWVALTVVVQAL